MSGSQSARDRLARARFWNWLAPLGNVVGVVCGLVGVVTDLFSTTVRLVIVGVGTLLWAVASVGAALVARVRRADEEEIGQLKMRLASAGVTDRELPDHTLRMVAPVIFRPGASWRLTIFVLEEHDGCWFLRPKIRCASTEMYEAAGRRLIPLESSVLRELRVLELPAYNELGDAPDRDAMPDEWQAWQHRFIDDPAIVKSLRMPTRKYAWCATRQPGLGGQTIALVAETVQPSGIKADVLTSNLLPPILEMVLRLVDLPDVLEPTSANRS